MMLLPIDREALRLDYIRASPFPFVKIDKFLDPVFAKEIAAAYPSFANATAQGRTFNAINERKSTHGALFSPVRSCPFQNKSMLEKSTIETELSDNV